MNERGKALIKRKPLEIPGFRWRFKGLEMERLMGIEPTLKAWEASILPLNYSRDSKWANAAKYSMASQCGQWGFLGMFVGKEVASC